MENFISVILGVISNVIFQIYDTSIGSPVRNLIERQLNPLRRILPFDLTNGNEITLIHGSIPPTNVDSIFSVLQGDLMAMVKAIDLASSLDKRKKIEVSNGQLVVSNLETLKNVFSISGPRWNPVTKKLLDKIGAPIAFSGTKEITIKDKSVNGEIIKRCIGNNKIPDICYGVIFSGELKYNNGFIQKYLICSGATTLSTFGAVKFINQMQESNFKCNIDKKIFKEKKWGILLQIKNNQFNDAVFSLSENDIEIEVLKSFKSSDFF